MKFPISPWTVFMIKVHFDSKGSSIQNKFLRLKHNRNKITKS